MRDIRSDLQDRINLLREQINIAQSQFERHVEHIKQERDGRLGDLKVELKAVNTIIDTEQRRLGTASSLPQKAQQSQRVPPQMRLADFLMRKLSEGGNLSSDSLCHLAIQEGYFADSGRAEPTVRETLTQIGKAGLVRQLPNGCFALPTVTHAIGLRQAV